MKSFSWDSEEVIYDGEKFFETLCEKIDSAKSNIDIEVYIFSNEERPAAIVEKLIQASRRGVKVRLLVDGIGSFGFSRTLMPQLREGGVEVRVYHPTPWDYNISRLLWWVRWRTYLIFLGLLNRRNHRKTYVFDQKTAIVSSSNLTQFQLISEGDVNSWRDTTVVVQGEEVSQLIHAFDRAWNYSTGLKEILDRRGLKTFNQELIHFNFTREQRRRNYMDLIYRLYSSERKIWITNAYFVPDGSFVRALRFAAWTGVEVNVMVPHKSDIFFMRWVASAFYFGLLLAGLRIFEYMPRVLHAKSLIVDEWARVGTSNLNHRSLFQDLEVDIVLTKPESVESLNKQFVRDLYECKAVTMEDWLARPRLEKWVGLLLLKFRYWI